MPSYRTEETPMPLTPKLRPNANPVIQRFLTHCHRRRYPNKSVIIYAGDPPDALYYITNGSVAVVNEDDEGREIVLAYLSAGAFFGEMGLFETEKHRSAWVRARYVKWRKSATTAFASSRRKIRIFCSRSPRKWRCACAAPAIC